ncbi:glycosyltransferase family 2 protein [Haloplasma contractile]|uniref:Dolichol-phosphate mannosyltransferase protein n=1 Tax=Haloplasma contractile SSD-17B TaxID=1033810 RepID=U2E850_9MOLU|nr:glycosyltransferase family 2 protein [Haloplasma contractile]ERJ11051.1 dolichol-phosphate mannosyltransferase protein [Haloplasma contractile SSD-17B]
MEKVLVMIPAYNEEDNIEHVVNSVIEKCPQYDYVVINDGSIDRTAEICKNNNYNVIDLPVNTGIGIVVQTGFKYALYNGYDYAVQFDCDGQHYPEYIEPLVERAKEGYNIVIGSRFVNCKKGRSLRMLGSRILSALIYVTTRNYIADPTSGMKVYDRSMLTYYAREINAAPEPDDLVYHMRCGKRVSEVGVKMGERLYGLSYFNFVTGTFFIIYMTVSILLVQTVLRKKRV